jgi:hypothetical protein
VAHCRSGIKERGGATYADDDASDDGDDDEAADGEDGGGDDGGGDDGGGDDGGGDDGGGDDGGDDECAAAGGAGSPAPGCLAGPRRNIAVE